MPLKCSCRWLAMLHCRKEKLQRTLVISISAAAGLLDEPKFSINPQYGTITAICLDCMLFSLMLGSCPKILNYS